MKITSPKKPAPKPEQGQLTINLFAMFMSLASFLFIQQAGILVLNVMFGLNYPKNVDNVTNFLGAITLIIVLTFLFFVASQAGFEIIRRTKADQKIFIVYNMLTLVFLAVQAITLAMMIFPIYIVPNIMVGIATVYSLYCTIKGIPASFLKRARNLRK